MPKVGKVVGVGSPGGKTWNKLGATDMKMTIGREDMGWCLTFLGVVSEDRPGGNVVGAGARNGTKNEIRAETARGIGDGGVRVHGHGLLCLKIGGEVEAVKGIDAQESALSGMTDIGNIHTCMCSSFCQCSLRENIFRIRGL